MTDDNGDRRLDAAEPADLERRSALLAMAKVMAYVPPAVATFAMGGMSARAAAAYLTNLS
ncbi:MAG: hypothetical protein P4M07_09275 [Xanthobacteraceae bacterium]|nr:hypothetical protein [Xanthobacteraceae bacterium]